MFKWVHHLPAPRRILLVCLVLILLRVVLFWSLHSTRSYLQPRAPGLPLQLVPPVELLSALESAAMVMVLFSDRRKRLKFFFVPTASVLLGLGVVWLALSQQIFPNLVPSGLALPLRFAVCSAFFGLGAAAMLAARRKAGWWFLVYAAAEAVGQAVAFVVLVQGLEQVNIYALASFVIGLSAAPFGALTGLMVVQSRDKFLSEDNDPGLQEG